MSTNSSLNTDNTNTIINNNNSKNADLFNEGVKIHGEKTLSFQYLMFFKCKYVVWAIKMEVFLTAQGLWDAVEGATPMDAKKEKWDLAAIFEEIGEDILLRLGTKKSVKKAWDIIKTMNEGAEGSNKPKAASVFHHPFGDTYERDANIVNNRKDLFLVDTIPEAFDFITNLLDPIPDLRPKAASVFHHPLFWSSDTRLSFLRDASDRVELEDRENELELLKALESVGGVALGGKWDEKLDNSFLDNISHYRRYNYDSVRDLLRVVRNKLSHYRELPTTIQESLGSVPEGFDLFLQAGF